MFRKLSLMGFGGTVRVILCLLDVYDLMFTSHCIAIGFPCLLKPKNDFVNFVLIHCSYLVTSLLVKILFYINPLKSAFFGKFLFFFSKI